MWIIIPFSITFEPENQKGVNPILYLRYYVGYFRGFVYDFIVLSTSFFLDQYVTYCCLILGPAVLGQNLDLQQSASESARNSKEKYILSQT
jgi:hypothetical protein